MFPVIDFRNGRYQGQTRDHLPHGYGCFMDRNFLFCIGEWVAGELQGNAIIIFPSGAIFYGRINYRRIQDLCFFQLAEDHVQLITYLRPQNPQKYSQKTAAVLPLLNIILDIDSGGPQSRVLKEYQYSNSSEETNLNTISKILNLDRNDSKRLQFCQNFIEYFRNTFYSAQNSIFQYLVSNSKGKKEYFLGLKGQGLGVKIEPTEQIGLNMKNTGKVYFIRGMGYFSKDNQLRDIGIKMIDNAMKGTIYQEGVFSLPKTVIKYEKGKRPVNCSVNFSNYIKRSLFYRDKVLNTEYLYFVQSFIVGFNVNLRKVQTQRHAQVTIQNPKKQPQLLYREEFRKPIKQQPLYQAKKTVYEPFQQNPYNPAHNKTVNPEYNIDVTTDNIYRSASKKQYMRPSQLDAYRNIEYVDPMYAKIDRNYGLVPLQKRDSPRRYREPREQYPPQRDYRIRNNYDYQDQYRARSPPRNTPQRDYQQYPESNYPDSLYPQRTTSPRRPEKYSPSFNSYDQPGSYRPESYYGRRR